MKYLLVVFAISLITSCTDNPTLDPTRTAAKAIQDQVKILDSIHVQLKRIADLAEKESSK